MPHGRHFASDLQGIGAPTAVAKTPERVDRDDAPASPWSTPATDDADAPSALALALQAAMDQAGGDVAFRPVGDVSNHSATLGQQEANPRPKVTPPEVGSDGPVAATELPWADDDQVSEPESDQSTSDTEPTVPPSDRLQRTLYVVEPGCTVGKESERLQIHLGDTLLLEVPILDVDLMVMFGQHPLSPAALHLCSQHQVPVVFLSRLGRFVGRFDPGAAGPSTQLLRQQCRALDDEPLQLALARVLIAAKLRNSAVVLQRATRRRSDHEALAVVRETVRQLREDALRTRTAKGLEQLRGLEGQAARAYFAVLRTLIGPTWGFQQRQRQPPPDPVNALLSLGYTLLYHSVAGLLQARGLNPYLGVFHATGGDHQALASDMMEPLRAPVVDSVVLDWCLNGTIVPGDFVVSADGCTIPSATTRQWIHAYEQRLSWVDHGLTQTLRHRIDQQIQGLIRALHQGDAGLFEASVWR